MSKLLYLIIFAFFIQNVNANNLNISTVTLLNDSTISFNVSWDNSWNVSSAPFNWDAVWIYVKRKDCASNQWSHVNLSTKIGDHTTVAPLQVDTVSDGKGVFVRRAAVGSGNISSTLVTLRMKNLPAGQFDFKVMGIEMVYVPQSQFYLGDGASVNTFRTGATTNPYLLLNESAVTVANSGTALGATALLPASNIPAAYPKGFASFYSMKYEITHGQWIEFLNSINVDQAINRANNTAANRLNITGAWPLFATTVPYRAVGNLAWADLLAFLDWSALRPMSEFEFEKSCRGPVFPVAGELAWGTSNLTDANTPANDGTATETCSEIPGAGGAIVNINNSSVNPNGPYRVGFAGTASSSRLSSGASYYGIMELSGNVWEHVISGSTATGLTYTGVLGDGEISSTPTPGFADTPGWPNVQASVASATSAPGAALKGGAFTATAAESRVSDRTYSNYDQGVRATSFGGRGVRQW